MTRPLAARELSELMLRLPENLTTDELTRLLTGVARVAEHAYTEGYDAGQLRAAIYQPYQHTDTQQEDES